VLTAHILTAAGWFGITVVVAAGVVAASATGDVAFARAPRRAVGAAFWVSVPMGLLGQVLQGLGIGCVLVATLVLLRALTVALRRLRESRE